MKKLHLLTGIALLILFAISGQYMMNVLKLPDGDFTAQRMMYRASHIYLLWAGATNALLGCYWVQFNGKYIKYIQGIASSCVLLAQPVLVLAFWLEPPAINIDRTLTLYGCLLLLAGVILTLISAFFNKP